jgi:hypothetical protein
MGTWKHIEGIFLCKICVRIWIGLSGQVRYIYRVEEIG